MISSDSARLARQDAFVHQSVLRWAGLDELVEGDRVEFDVRPSVRKAGRFEVRELRKIGSAPKAAVKFGGRY